MIHLLLALIYLAFIGLGLPDSLLGAAWPSMYEAMQVPVSYAGVVSTIIAVGTVISSLQSDRLTRRLGAGKVTALSVGLTALALLGFSASHSFWMLCLWAIPYGLGAGSVDAALNNYVALHYASRHMSWLHCMWGVGASLGPAVIGRVLTGGLSWNAGYRAIGLAQLGLTAILFCSLPLWKKQCAVSPPTETAAGSGGENQPEAQTLSLKQVLKIPGAKEIMAAFFCYSALEQTTGLWASSYLALHSGAAPEEAAWLASLFFLGITAGRALSGFLTFALDDTKMTRLGQLTALVGVGAILLPAGSAKVGLLLVGLGCAPIYPSIIHATPSRFGADRSQAIIGIQMASAYVGSCLMPPLFGLLAERVGIALFPVFLLAVLVLMAVMHEKTVAAVKKSLSPHP